MKDKLTPKQKLFADYYIETGNATESAKRAGYSEKTARTIGNENLTKPNIFAYIARRTKKADEKRIATGDEVMEFLTRTMRGEIKDSFGLESSLQDRMNAAKELAKRLVDVSDRKEEYESDGFMDALKGNVAETFKNAEGNIDE